MKERNKRNQVPGPSPTIKRDPDVKTEKLGELEKLEEAQSEMKLVEMMSEASISSNDQYLVLIF